MNQKFEYQPFIPSSAKVAELTLKALGFGAFFGLIFAASSMFLVLKVGMTVSASIPIAVLCVTLFRVFWRATILENNIAQTTGSAGESIAFAVATVPPALLVMGFEMKPTFVMLVATLGGLLGILMMIPLRRGLIVKEHGVLPYPEGTACAEVLIAGEKGGTSARLIVAGFGIGVIYKFLNVGLKLWTDVGSWVSRKILPGASVSVEVSTELLGVGYIIGPRVAGITVAGGVLSFLILVPAIKFFGGDKVANMGPMEVRNAYLLYIGAGAVAMAGIISVLRALPSIASAFRSGMDNLVGSRALAVSGERTDQDMPMSVVLVGSLLLILVLSFAIGINPVGALLMVVFGFIFVTVSARITGEIGSSSNPISGMTISALLFSCLIFVALGWTDENARYMVVGVAAIVCIAASNGGTTAQDLKTGYLVGSTPWKQQVAIAVGALSSALLCGYIMMFLNNANTCVVPVHTSSPIVISLSKVENMQVAPDGNRYEVRYLRELRGGLQPGQYLTESDTGVARWRVDPGILGTATEAEGCYKAKFDAPKARLMALIVDGIMTQKLPWALVLLGAFIALMIELCGVASLPFAVGVYLPISTTVPIFVGGAVRWFVDRRRDKVSGESSPGVLLSSGFIAGGAICGIVLALFAAKGWDKAVDLSSRVGAFASSNFVALGIFAALATFLYVVGSGRLLRGKQG